MRYRFSKLPALLLGGLLLTGCQWKVKEFNYLVKLKKEECKECLERVKERGRVVKEYSSVECLYLIKTSPEKAQEIKGLECVDYLERDREYRILYH